MAKYELFEVFINEDKAKRNADFYRSEGYLASVRKGHYGIRNGRIIRYGLYIGGFRKR